MFYSFCYLEESVSVSKSQMIIYCRDLDKKGAACMDQRTENIEYPDISADATWRHVYLWQTMQISPCQHMLVPITKYDSKFFPEQ